jgi:trehalose synthase
MIQMANELMEKAAAAAELTWENDPLWYKDAIIYELHVKAFKDSGDDGIGDFKGLTEKLDYIQDLGVNTVWLLPFYPSPMRDDGYDISDYHNVSPDYGNRNDARVFIREAHRRGLRVITELVINHTSDQHPWFQAARRAPAGSKKRDFYVWSDTDKKFPETRIIFTDTEKSNWAWDDVAKAYYWHRFFSHQPDLNHNNPDVVKAVIRIMRFWLDMGVDGLRLDAIPYLCVREGTNNENVPETHEVIKQIRAVIDSRYKNRMLLAEANMWPEDVREYFGDGDECHMAYNFPVMPRIFMAVAQEERHPIIEIMNQTPEIPENCQWAIFLRNHDELTLEMVTESERAFMYKAYASDPRMRVNVGIRRRLAPLMDNNRHKIELVTFLILTLPGSPVLYYGDEIGMGDNIYLGDRNGVRTPMQWSPDRNAGFSRADPQRLYLPPNMDPIYGYEAINVEAQARNPSSLLHWTKRLIAVRKNYKAFGRGSIIFLEPGNRKILAYVREYEDETLLCVVNLSRNAQPVELDLMAFKGRVPVELSRPLGLPADRRSALPADPGRPRHLLLPPDHRRRSSLLARRTPGSRRAAGTGAHRGLADFLGWQDHRHHRAPGDRRHHPRPVAAQGAGALPAHQTLVCRQGARHREHQDHRAGAVGYRQGQLVADHHRSALRRHRATGLLPAAGDLLGRPDQRRGACLAGRVGAGQSAPAGPHRPALRCLRLRRLLPRPGRGNRQERDHPLCPRSPRVPRLAGLCQARRRTRRTGTSSVAGTEQYRGVLW